MSDQLTTADVAALLGVTPATVRSYTARGVMPPPDGHLGRTPWWRRKTITDWQAARPGQGVGGGRPRQAARLRRTAHAPQPEQNGPYQARPEEQR